MHKRCENMRPTNWLRRRSGLSQYSSCPASVRQLLFTWLQSFANLLMPGSTSSSSSSSQWLMLEIELFMLQNWLLFVVNCRAPVSPLSPKSGQTSQAWGRMVNTNNSNNINNNQHTRRLAHIQSFASCSCAAKYAANFFYKNCEILYLSFYLAQGVVKHFQFC